MVWWRNIANHLIPACCCLLNSTPQLNMVSRYERWYTLPPLLRACLLRCTAVPHLHTLLRAFCTLFLTSLPPLSRVALRARAHARDAPHSYFPLTYRTRAPLSPTSPPHRGSLDVPFHLHIYFKLPRLIRLRFCIPPPHADRFTHRGLRLHYTHAARLHARARCTPHAHCTRTPAHTRLRLRFLGPAHASTVHDAHRVLFPTTGRSPLPARTHAACYTQFCALRGSIRFLPRLLRAPTFSASRTSFTATAFHPTTHYTTHRAQYKARSGRSWCSSGSFTVCRRCGGGFQTYARTHAHLPRTLHCGGRGVGCDVHLPHTYRTHTPTPYH